MNRRDTRRGRSWASWSLSILLHLGIVAIAAGFWFWSQRHPAPQRLAIEGSVVTAAEYEAATAAEPVPPPPLPEEPFPEEPVPEPEPEPEFLPEPLPPEEDPVQLQAEADRLLAEQRLAEEQLQRAEQERVAQAQRERERVERERAEQEKAQRERAERERTERLERERQARERAEREQREREEAERSRREAELASQLAAEEQRQAVRGSAQARQYSDLIRARIERNWVRPPSARVGLMCEVRVTQAQGGTVIRVGIGSCNGDEAVRQSIEAAVYRASPLPPPPDPALFERELIFNFAPEN